jgi:mono/diheme cytochrome c family protein
VKTEKQESRPAYVLKRFHKDRDDHILQILHKPFTKRVAGDPVLPVAVIMKNRKLKMLILFGATPLLLNLIACKANQPSRAEKKIVQKSKQLVINGKDWRNPISDDASSVKSGAEHFQRHCQVCHGLDGHAVGVPFAQNMSPPVPDLGAADIQKYTDGQLKWITENGIRMSGMPAWKGLLDDDEMWQMVRYIRHLPKRHGSK